jgi:hypothetical protein
MALKRLPFRLLIASVKGTMHTPCILNAYFYSLLDVGIRLDKMAGRISASINYAIARASP